VTPGGGDPLASSLKSVRPTGCGAAGVVDARDGDAGMSEMTIDGSESELETEAAKENVGGERADRTGDVGLPAGLSNDRRTIVPTTFLNASLSMLSCARRDAVFGDVKPGVIGLFGASPPVPVCIARMI
jgi:hypothetical protein